MTGVATKIVINATGAVATINKVNQALTRMTAPTRGLSIALNKLGDTTGVSRLGSALSRVGSIGNAASSALSGIAGPLGVLTGAATLAGLGRLVTTMADMTRATMRAGQSIGVSANQMRVFQNALGLADVGAEEATSAITGLRETMQGAAWGRNSDAARILTRWGYNLNSIRGGAVDLNQVLPDLAERFQAMRDPIAAGRVATELFGAAGARMLPVLRQGRAAMEQYLETGRRNANITREQEEAAVRLGRSQAGLSNAVTDLGGKISTALTPVLVPIIDKISEWITLNGTWLSQNIAGWLDSAATALGTVGRILSTFTGGDGSAGDGIAKITGLVGVLAGVSMVSAVSRLTGLTSAFSGLTWALGGVARLVVANPWIAALMGVGAVVSSGLAAGQREHGNQQQFLGGAQGRFGQRGRAGGFYSAPAVDPDAPAGAPAGPGDTARRNRTDAEFATEFGPEAERIAQQYSVPTSYVLGHWSLETGNGARFAGRNNLGNMTATPGQDATSGGDHDAAGQPITQRFRNFGSLREFADGYGSWLGRRAQGVNGSNTPQAYGTALQRGGYAASPAFTNNLSGAIRRFERLPASTTGAPVAPGTAPTPAASGAAPGPGPLSQMNGTVNIVVTLNGSGAAGAQVSTRTSSPQLRPATRQPVTGSVMPNVG